MAGNEYETKAEFSGYINNNDVLQELKGFINEQLQKDQSVELTLTFPCRKKEDIEKMIRFFMDKGLYIEGSLNETTGVGQYIVRERGKNTKE